MINTHFADIVPEKMPYFSIILPIYNVERYLEECIRSILNQGYQNYELILVDDGSTDNCPAICDAYAAQFDQIRVLHKRNGGLSSARNAGTEEARGMYIWWVDSDDWIEPDALQILQNATCADYPDMVKFDYYRVGSQRKLFSCDVMPGDYDSQKSLEQLLDEGFLHPGKFSLSAWGYIYRREFLRENAMSFVSERVIGSEDYLFNLCALASAKRIRVLKNALYSYRMRPGSLTQRYRKELPEKYTELYRQLCSHYDKMGVLDDFRGRICTFYVWHLLHGTCFANEYRITDDHTQKEGRRKVHQFLRMKELSYALRHCDANIFSRAQRIQLVAMRLRLEPLFYWLFVIKPEHVKVKNV